MKEEIIRIRISSREKEIIRQAADENQMSMSEYILSIVRAEEIKKEGRP